MSRSALAGISRRRFIHSSAAAATIAVAAREGRAENLGYIDAHSHLWSPDRPYFGLTLLRRLGQHP